MDFTLNLDSLLQGCHGVFQELLLLVVLFPNVRIDVTILGLLVLDVGVQVLLHSHFKLLVVINVLDCPEYCILEPIDILFIASNDVLALSDQQLDLLLSASQILHHVPKIGILLIVFLEFLVHGLGASL